MSGLIGYVASGALGAIVGASELVGRYRDAPVRALNTAPAALYIALNAVSALAALALMRLFNWNLGLKAGDAREWIQVLAAGLGAMALLRSAIFMVRAGDRDVGVGPSGFLQIFLDAADAAVNRSRAESRAGDVTKTMEGVQFDLAFEALPALCLALMQNVSPDEQKELAEQTDRLKNADIPERAKVLNLGLALTNFVGRETLLAAVEALAPDIAPTRPEKKQRTRFIRLKRPLAQRTLENTTQQPPTAGNEQPPAGRFRPTTETDDQDGKDAEASDS